MTGQNSLAKTLTLPQAIGLAITLLVVGAIWVVVKMDRGIQKPILSN